MASFSLLRAWASAGTRIKPSDGKIDQGWLAGEQPPMEYENERMNTRDTRINEIIAYLNAGVPLADIVTSSTDSLVIATTGSQTTVNNSGFLVEKTTGDIATFEVDSSGYNARMTTAGSELKRITPLVVDLTGETWSVIRAITTNWDRYRAGGTYEVVGVGANSLSCSMTAFLVCRTGTGQYQTIPVDCTTESSGGSFHLLLDNVTVTWETNPGGYSEVNLVLIPAQLYGSATPL